MNKDIPEIDELLSGINEPAGNPGAMRPAPPAATVQTEAEMEKAPTDVPATATNHPYAMDGFWQEVLDTLRNDAQPKDRTAYCMIDRDLADTLDECRIHGQCRTGLVNAILRVAIKTYLPRLAEYRRETSSFFQSPKNS